MIHASYPGEESPCGKGKQLGIDEVNARGSRGNFVLADGNPGTTKARVAQADVDKDRNCNQRQYQIVVRYRGITTPMDARQLWRIEADKTIYPIRVSIQF